MRQFIPRRCDEEIIQLRMHCRPLLPESGCLQHGWMLSPEQRHKRQQLRDEIIGGVVRRITLYRHRGPLHARSTSVHMKHARLHMTPDRFGRNLQPAATEEGQ